ncbi:23990_t:CDS:2, partial [Gigaspora margarita]
IDNEIKIINKKVYHKNFPNIDVVKINKEEFETTCIILNEILDPNKKTFNSLLEIYKKEEIEKLNNNLLPNGLKSNNLIKAIKAKRNSFYYILNIKTNKFENDGLTQNEINEVIKKINKKNEWTFNNWNKKCTSDFLNKFLSEFLKHPDEKPTIEFKVAKIIKKNPDKTLGDFLKERLLKINISEEISEQIKIEYNKKYVESKKKIDLLPDDWLAKKLTTLDLEFSNDYSNKDEFIDEFIRYEFDEDHNDSFKSILRQNYEFLGERENIEMSGQEVKKEELNLGRSMSATYKLLYVSSLIDFNPDLLLNSEEDFTWLKTYFSDLTDEHVKNINESFKSDFFKMENDLETELNKHIKVEFLEEQKTKQPKPNDKNRDKINKEIEKEKKLIKTTKEIRKKFGGVFDLKRFAKNKSKSKKVRVKDPNNSKKNITKEEISYVIDFDGLGILPLFTEIGKTTKLIKCLLSCVFKGKHVILIIPNRSLKDDRYVYHDSLTGWLTRPEYKCVIHGQEGHSYFTTKGDLSSWIDGNTNERKCVPEAEGKSSLSILELYELIIYIACKKVKMQEYSKEETEKLKGLSENYWDDYEFDHIKDKLIDKDNTIIVIDEAYFLSTAYQTVPPLLIRLNYKFLLISVIFSKKEFCISTTKPRKVISLIKFANQVKWEEEKELIYLKTTSNIYRRTKTGETDYNNQILITGLKPDKRKLLEESGIPFVVFDNTNSDAIRSSPAEKWRKEDLVVHLLSLADMVQEIRRVGRLLPGFAFLLILKLEKTKPSKDVIYHLINGIITPANENPMKYLAKNNYKLTPTADNFQYQNFLRLAVALPKKRNLPIEVVIIGTTKDPSSKYPIFNMVPDPKKDAGLIREEDLVYWHNNKTPQPSTIDKENQKTFN